MEEERRTMKRKIKVEKEKDHDKVKERTWKKRMWGSSRGGRGR